MRIRRRDERDDDWDDDDEIVVKKKPPRPEILTTRRILWGIAAIAIVAVLVGNVVSRNDFQFAETPAELIGMWTCGDPERSDLWVEFRPQFATFATGGTGTIKYRILGLHFDQVGEIARYTMFLRDLAGKEHSKEILISPPGDTLRFADDPRVNWSRYEQ